MDARSWLLSATRAVRRRHRQSPASAAKCAVGFTALPVTCAGIRASQKSTIGDPCLVGPRPIR